MLLKTSDQLNNRRDDKILNVLIQLYCLLLPFEEAIAGSFGSVVKIVGVLIIAYVIVAYKKIRIRKVNIALYIWIVIAAVSVLWTASIEWWEVYFKIYISQIIFLTVIVGCPVDAINLQKVRQALIFGSVIAAAIIIVFPQASGFTEDGRRTIILFGNTFDPNILSGIIILGIASALLEIFLATRGIAKKINLALIIIMLVGIFYTGSRGGLISATVVLAVSLFLEFKDHDNRKQARKLVVIGAIAISVVITLLPSSLMELRFSSNSILGLNEYAAGVHNRYSIWLASLKLIPQKPLLGYGLGSFMKVITSVYFRSSAAHNLFVVLVIETGFIGLILFCIFLRNILRKLRVNSYSITYGMLLGIIVLSLTLDSLPYKYFWIALIYAELMLYKKGFD